MEKEKTMKSKQNWKTVVSSAVVAAAMLAASIPLNALAASAEYKGLQPPILQGVQREVKTYEEPLPPLSDGILKWIRE